MTFKLTTLGSSSALPTVNKYHSAHVLNIHEQFYLIDAGEGVQTQLKRYGINLLKIDHIFISHLHGDHVYGLFGLISTMGLLGREKNLSIYAPAPVEEMLASHFQYFDTRLPYPVTVHTLDIGSNAPVYSNRVMDVYPIPLKHKIPSCGFLFREKVPQRNVKKYLVESYALSLHDIAAAKRGEDVTLPSGEILRNDYLTYLPYTPRSFAYCSDTAYSGTVVERVRGVDLLYHEATFLDSDRKIAKATGHSTACQAATVAREAGVGKLLIGHFSLRYKGETQFFLQEARQVFPDTDLAEEGNICELKADKLNF